MKPIVLEDANIQAVFDAQTGALVGLLNKPTGWSVQSRPELGLSFRMMAPLPRRRNNPILGGEQAPPKVELSHDGRRVVFTWQGLRSRHGGQLDITFVATVALAEGVLTFEGQVQNRSPHAVENVSYPCLGDVSLPSPQEQLTRMSCGYAGMDSSSLLPRFDGDSGYFGFDHPFRSASFPGTPFILADSGRQGLYVGCHDTSAKESITFAWELKPGFETALSVASGLAALSGQIDGKPSHLELAVWHFPFAAPGQRADLSPIALAPYVGTWHKGVDVYRNWRKTWFTPPPAPAWAKDVHSWQQIHINSPEDELRCQYKDLVKYGEDCARHGVKAIQLVGWNDGGQDRGNPSHDTDPRLGRWEDLRDAIAKIQALGVQLVLFSKFTWADRSGEWFRRELVRYACKDPYGDYHVFPGYKYQTPTQLANINTRRLVPMCHNAAAWREVANREFAKTLALGATGILYDESQHHGGSIYCFDPTHGHHVPAHVYAGDAPLAEGFRRLADARGEGVLPLRSEGILPSPIAQEPEALSASSTGGQEYLLAGEACYDLQYRHYAISYFRIGIGSAVHVPVQRYIDPRAGIMIAVTGFNDRHILNQCLLYRYIISYEPFNFKGRLDDFPRTMEYGKKIDALRRRYRQYLWDGEFQDTLGAEVTVAPNADEPPLGTPAGGKPHQVYSVYRDTKTGKSAVVVANLDNEKELAIEVRLAGGPAKYTMATPEDPSPRPTDGRFTLPPDSAAVVMET